MRRTDFTGFDDDTRDSGAAQLAFNSGKRINANNYTAAELRRMGQSLINAPLRLLQREDAPVNFSLGVTGGAAMETDIGTVGAVFAAGYDNGWKTREGVRQTGRLDAGQLVVANDYDFQSTQNDIGLNFLGGLSLVNGDTRDLSGPTSTSATSPRKPGPRKASTTPRAAPVART